jgi:hypothetical protein
MKYAIWCQVSGGITGYNYGWLKEGGVRKEFNEKFMADIEALRLNNAPKPVRRALFAYRVLEINGEKNV